VKAGSRPYRRWASGSSSAAAADPQEVELDVRAPILASRHPGGVRGVSLGRVKIGIRRFAVRLVESHLVEVGGSEG
jgi:hypothetical protein